MKAFGRQTYDWKTNIAEQRTEKRIHSELGFYKIRLLIPLTTVDT